MAELEMGEDMRAEYDKSLEGKLERLITNFENHIESNKRFTKRIEDMLYQHQVLFYGNGKKGVVERLALMEYQEKKREKFYFLFMSVALAFLGDVFFRILSTVRS